MRLKILIVFVLVNILVPIKSSAEILGNTRFENISINQGLSSENVTSIFQDSKGYMWIGTKDGLNRYDGERIRVYNCNPKNDNTLSSTYILDIEEDINGNIWIATNHGLDFLDTDTDTIIRMKDRDDKYNLGGLKITSLLKSSYEENIMWVGTENGLFKIDIKNENIKPFYHDPHDLSSLTSSSITSLEEDEDNFLWVGTRQGINRIDKNSIINSNENKTLKDKSFISYISKDKHGNMWISSEENIFVYNIKENQRKSIFIINSDGVKKYNTSEEKIDDVYTFKDKEVNIYNNFIFNDSEGNTWISSIKGAIKYEKDKNEFNIFKKDIRYKNSLKSNIITCFYEDSNGTIWIGTDKGANILHENIIFNYSNENEVNNIVSMLRHDNHIWVATKFKGIYIYDVKNGDLVDIIYQDERLNLNNRCIKNLFEINERYIIVVTNRDIISIDTKEDSYTKMTIGHDYSSEISYMYSDGEYIWIATTRDFYSINIDTKEKTYYSQIMKDVGTNPGHIKYILQDNKNENIIWLGGIDIGLIKYHKQKGVLEVYTNDSLNENSLINNHIKCMTFDNSGDLWIGTGIGISKFNEKTKKFTSYTTAEGLSNNFISSILVDDNSDIWISTNKGLNKFDKEKKVFINFEQIYGYQFNLNSSLKLRNGTMIFGSTDGYAYFNPDDLVDYKLHKNDVVIGDIFIGENKVFYDGNEIVLEYDDEDLYINYFVPDYESLNKITYEYMLEGINPKWINIGSKSNLDFESLDPGKYTLKIRARDAKGELTKETRMNIRVKNIIWKTPLAYIVYTITVFGLIIYILYYVKGLHPLVHKKTINLDKTLENDERLSKEIIKKEKLKNNYFVNLSHELRTPVNVISSTVQLIDSLSRNKNITYEKITQYMDIINKNCGNLLKLINDILDTSKIENGQYKIYKKNKDIVYIVEEATLNMSKFIEDKGISLIIEPEMEEKIISCDETEIERCIINLLSNAVKFTPEGGEIRVYIKEVENNIEITVEDTGIGISKEDQAFIFKRFAQVEGTAIIKTSSSGIGLAFVKHIVELHNGYIRLVSELNKGSRFTIGIPNIVERIEDR